MSLTLNKDMLRFMIWHHENVEIRQNKNIKLTISNFQEKCCKY